jgi:Bacterial regulatory proteins, luxR family
VAGDARGSDTICRVTGVAATGPGGRGRRYRRGGQRLYISRRTVQTHLAHVFAKLHITSRAQLAAEAIRHRR